MGSAIPRGELAEIVRAARARARVPGVAAGLLRDGEVELAADGVLALGGGDPVTPETPFRVASLTKWFTASLAVSCLDLDEPVAAGASARRLLAHTAGLRQNSRRPLPEPLQGLWSYSNASYVLAGEACAQACGRSYSEAVRERLLDPLGLASTGFEEPGRPARGHLQAGETGHRPVPRDDYPEPGRAAGGLWSTAADLLRFAEHQLGGAGPLTEAQRAALQEPQARALGADYALGCWRRPLAGGRTAVDHEGSVGGYQSLLLLVPAERAALAVLTNSWRGSGLIRRVVLGLGLLPGEALAPAETAEPEPGRFELDGVEAVVTPRGDGLRVADAEVDPLLGERIERAPYPVEPIGDGVYGFAGGVVMGHRIDFPRPGVIRVGWTALPWTGP